MSKARLVECYFFYFECSCKFDFYLINSIRKIKRLIILDDVSFFIFLVYLFWLSSFRISIFFHFAKKKTFVCWQIINELQIYASWDMFK
jgi:hypothetical protein